MFQELSTPPDPAVELERAILPDFETISQQCGRPLEATLCSRDRGTAQLDRSTASYQRP